MELKEKIDRLLRHISNVKKGCYVIGMKRIEQNKGKLGIAIIRNSLNHDLSKFEDIEFEVLVLEENPKNHPRFEEAVRHHNTSNPHHPECWNGIHNMPDEYVAEMCADWTARAGEQGLSVREWVHSRAQERYGFSDKDKVYKKIISNLDILLEKPFG